MLLRKSLFVFSSDPLPLPLSRDIIERSLTICEVHLSAFGEKMNSGWDWSPCLSEGTEAQYVVLFRQSALNSLSSFFFFFFCSNGDKEVLLGGASGTGRENTEGPFEYNKCEAVFPFSANKGGATGENQSESAPHVIRTGKKKERKKKVLLRTKKANFFLSFFFCQVL